MFGANPFAQLFRQQLVGSGQPSAPKQTVESPVDLIKNLATFAGFLGGRTTETPEGRDIQMGDPATSDFADMLTGASGLQDLMSGNVTGGNLLDAAGVAADAGIPGPPVMPLLGSLLPMDRVMDFMRRGSDEVLPFVRGSGTPEDLLQNVANDLVNIRGGRADPVAGELGDVVAQELAEDPAQALGRFASLLKFGAEREGLPNMLFADLARIGETGGTNLGSFRNRGASKIKGTPASGAEFFDPSAIAPGNAEISLSAMPANEAHDQLMFAADKSGKLSTPEVAGHEMIHGAFTQLPSSEIRRLMADESSINMLVRNIDAKQGGVGTSYYADKGLPLIVNEGVASAFPHLDRLPESLRDDFGPLFDFLTKTLGIPR